ncbi:MAG: serine/threonine-protein kinase [Myxococcota bacterium]
MGSVQCAACGVTVKGTLLFCTACGSRVGPDAGSDTELDIAPPPPSALAAGPAPGPEPASAPASSPTAPTSEVPTRVEIPVVAGGGEFRRYRDGVIVGASGVRVAELPQGQAPLPLPYASTDVLRSLGPYDLLTEIGRGDTGVVYAAFSRPRAKPCAVKVMIAGEHATEADIRHFRAQAALGVELDHPNIVTVFDSGEERGRFYFAMRFVEGRSFRELMEEVHRTRAPDALERAVRALAKTARVIQFAHDAGFVHRDIKPGNIIVAANGEAHVTDFGIAKLRRGESVPAAAPIVGTPSYMSPEQASGDASLLSPRSDVFSLGAVLYDLCTGRPPFVSESSNDTISTFASLLGETPEPASKVAARKLGWSLAPALEAICHRAIAQDPSARYPSAAALAVDLEAWLDKRPISAAPPVTSPPVTAPPASASTGRRARAEAPSAVWKPRAVAAVVVALAVGFGLVAALTRADLREATRELAIDAALAEAATLQRAISQHMLQGRPDLARELVNTLRDAAATRGVDVVRVDRTLAFTDKVTRIAVEARLGDSSALAWSRDAWPELPGVVQTVKEVALPAIDRATPRKSATFEYDPREWDAFLARGQSFAYESESGGEPMLTVLQPIPNEPKCQACHGDVEQGIYGLKNSVRAVLVVRRSRAAVEQRARGNAGVTAGAAVATAVLLLGLLWFITRRRGRASGSTAA